MPKYQCPVWNPTRITKNKLNSVDFYTRYNALRSSSCNFTKRKDVRTYIFSRDGYKCCNCGSTQDLTIDHIISVLDKALSGKEILKTNSPDNLQTLCLKCNSGKQPLLEGD